jgi:hypothetical protein
MTKNTASGNNQVCLEKGFFEIFVGYILPSNAEKMLRVKVSLVS